MGKVFIASAKRTAIGSFNGSLSSLHPAEFAAPAARAALEAANAAPDEVSEAIVGNVLSAGLMQGLGRQVAMRAGIPDRVPAHAVNMVCGSGMKAVMEAFLSARAGFGGVFLAGGAECMSMSPYLIPGARQGLRMGDAPLWDHMARDALTDAFSGTHMGMTAENVAERLGISRRDQDEYAFASQRKAIRASDSCAFLEEIVPVRVARKGGEILFDKDECPNRSTSLEKLSKLRPCFKEGGTVTAGNSSGINDGAAFLTVVDEESASRLGARPMAEILSFGQGGVDPSVMGLGPVPAIRAALDMAGLKLGDIGALELNEAFAAQALGVVRELSLEHGAPEGSLLDRINLNGGALALGHPVGASGARVMVTLLHIMKARGVELGLASLCIGGGMGIAVVLKQA
jgi:acetyl-CoA C-acetyltransferase